MLSGSVKYPEVAVVDTATSRGRNVQPAAQQSPHGGEPVRRRFVGRTPLGRVYPYQFPCGFRLRVHPALPHQGPQQVARGPLVQRSHVNLMNTFQLADVLTACDDRGTAAGAWKKRGDVLLTEGAVDDDEHPEPGE